MTDSINKMPVEDMYDYVATMIEEHAKALDTQEKFDFARDCLQDEESIRAYVDDHISLMVSDDGLKAAILGSVDFGQLFDWVEWQLLITLKYECECCNELIFQDENETRGCCGIICRKCVNKHDETCKDYENQKIQEEMENKVQEYLALREEACLYG